MRVQSYREARDQLSPIHASGGLQLRLGHTRDHQTAARHSRRPTATDPHNSAMTPGAWNHARSRRGAYLTDPAQPTTTRQDRLCDACHPSGVGQPELRLGGQATVQKHQAGVRSIAVVPAIGPQVSCGI